MSVTLGLSCLQASNSNSSSVSAAASCDAKLSNMQHSVSDQAALVVGGMGTDIYRVLLKKTGQSRRKKSKDQTMPFSMDIK